MADLSDERLAVLIARAMAPPNTSQEIYAGEMNQIVTELQRRRAEQAAGREHVERVAREIAYHEAAGHDCIGGSTLNRVSDAIARRVADRLSVPVLSAEDVQGLTRIRDYFDTDFERHWLTVLDRLIAGSAPAATLTEDERRAAAGWRAVNAPWGNPRDVVERNHNAVVAIIDRLIAGAKP